MIEHNQIRVDSEYWLQRGLQFKESGDWIMASSCFDNSIELDKTNWRVWLLSGQANAYLGRYEYCQTSIINSEIYGRPIREDDYFKFFSSSELNRLIDFLKEEKNKYTSYNSIVSLSLIYFYSHDLNNARTLLLPLSDGVCEKTAWVVYFLSRLEFVLGKLECRINKLDFLHNNFIKGNPRVLFLLGKMQLRAGCKVLNTFNKWYSTLEYNGGHDHYLEFRDVFGSAVYSLERAIKIGPVRAEYYFLLGEIYVAYGSRGAGFNEYHEAVKLDPYNVEYILARVSSTWSGSSEVDLSEASHIIAYAEAADVCPNNVNFLLDAAIAFYRVKSYASSLLMFNEAAHLKPPYIEELWQKEHRELHSEEYLKMQADCIYNLLKLFKYIDSEILKKSATAERIYWKKLSA